MMTKKKACAKVKICKSSDSFDFKFKRIEKNCEELVLIMNESKTVYMRKIEDLKIDGRIFKGVDKFKYLGEVINNEAKSNTASQKRIQW